MGMEAQAKKRLQIETDLRRAVERQEFMLHYQPIVDLVTGKIESFEALMRWHHPELGIVPVPEFIHIAEETGMILPMGRWVLSTACSQAVTWQQRFPHASKLGISVNMSAKEFLAPDFLSCIKGTLTQTGLDPECLRIEVTENVLMRETDEARDTLKALRALGVHLSIDDFGTGYSSLSYLNRFPVSNVKIDLSFVSQLQVSAESLQLVKTILALAGNLQLSVTAEGIATQEQLGLLRELQCGYGQGYLFSKPMDASSVGQLLTSDPKW
jgi:EAL domain-containing protein (putative c-di-GMP-specific phosphodiesterase class I)